MDIRVGPSEWLLPKSLQTVNAGDGAGKKEPSYTVGGSANYQFSGAQLSSQSNSHNHTWPLEKP